jgi:hypothetical protein
MGDVAGACGRDRRGQVLGQQVGKSCYGAISPCPDRGHEARDRGSD